MPSPTAILSRPRPGPRIPPGSPSFSLSSARRSSCNFRIDYLNPCILKNESRLRLFLKTPPKRIISCSASRERATRHLMANVNTKRGVIGILTGGGDVPGLNPAIRAVTFRALREGYEVVGIRHGWAGLVDMVRDDKHDN